MSRFALYNHTGHLLWQELFEPYLSALQSLILLLPVFTLCPLLLIQKLSSFFCPFPVILLPLFSSFCSSFFARLSLFLLPCSIFDSVSFSDSPFKVCNLVISLPLSFFLFFLGHSFIISLFFTKFFNFSSISLAHIPLNPKPLHSAQFQM